MSVSSIRTTSTGELLVFGEKPKSDQFRLHQHDRRPLRLCDEHGLDGFVVDGRIHARKASERYQAYLAAQDPALRLRNEPKARTEQAE